MSVGGIDEVQHSFQRIAVGAIVRRRWEAENRVQVGMGCRYGIVVHPAGRWR